MVVMRFLQSRVAQPLLALLKQGLSSEKLALSIALGVALGVFPILGTSTLLCLAAGWLLRLNQPALQLVNYLVSPLQLIFFLPLVRTGEFLFQAQPIPFSVLQILTMLERDLLGSIVLLWQTTVHAVAGWMLLAPLLVVSLYLCLHAVFSNVLRRASISSSGLPKAA